MKTFHPLHAVRRLVVLKPLTSRCCEETSTSSTTHPTPSDGSSREICFSGTVEDVISMMGMWFVQHPY